VISDDTFVAISSAVGPAARMIIRLSGGRAIELVASIAGIDAHWPPGARRLYLSFSGLSLPAWLYLFRAPHSYSGEDLVELHIPGNPLLAQMLIRDLIARGARPAEPGEFTARAYFNGRMGLEQAEGVAATIAAHNQQELRAARQLAAGELSRRLSPIMDQLAQTLALVEVGIDFTEEDVTFISGDELRARIDQVDAAIADLLANSARFERLSHEPQFALVGRPNAGKSTLLNALAGIERAVVTPVAGTTRDLLSAEVSLDRGIVRVIDAAGIDVDAPPSSDTSPHATIARRMHEQALRAVESADFILLVHDSTDPRPPLRPPRRPDLVVHSKADLRAELAPSSPDGEDRGEGGGLPLPSGEDLMHASELSLSAKTGLNLNRLRRRMSELAFGGASPAASALALNSRHLSSLENARAALARARAAADSAAEIIALELREALDDLGQILGALTPDDVLARVFATFCIGK